MTIKNFVLAFLILALYSCKERKVQLKNYKENIFSLKSSQSVNGNGFVVGLYGGMNINTSSQYVFFTKDSLTGGFVRTEIPTNYTVLVEKDTIPSLKRYYWRETVRVPDGFGKKDSLIDWEYQMFRKENMSKYEYILYVPKGTITENISYNPL